MDQWNSIVSPEMNSHTCGHLVCDKGDKNTGWRKDMASVSGAGKSGRLHVKSEIRTLPNTIYKNKNL